MPELHSAILQNRLIVQRSRIKKDEIGIHLKEDKEPSFLKLMETGTLRFEDENSRVLSLVLADKSAQAYLKINEAKVNFSASRRIVVVRLPEAFIAARYVWVSMDGYKAGARFELK